MDHTNMQQEWQILRDSIIRIDPQCISFKKIISPDIQIGSMEGKIVLKLGTPMEIAPNFGIMTNHNQAWVSQIAWHRISEWDLRRFWWRISGKLLKCLDMQETKWHLIMGPRRWCKLMSPWYETTSDQHVPSINLSRKFSILKIFANSPNSYPHSRHGRSIHHCSSSGGFRSTNHKDQTGYSHGCWRA